MQTEQSHKPTPVESAQLLLQLYDLRREAKMREARTWLASFKPESYDDILAVNKGPDSAKLRMVLSYWDMAAALVNHGAIDATMFAETSGECVFAFAKAYPYLAQTRESYPGYLMHLEKVINGNANLKKLLDGLTKH